MIIKELKAVLGIDPDKQSFNLTENFLNNLRSKVADFGALLTSGAVVYGLANIVQEVSHGAREVDNFSKRIHVTAQEFQGLNAVASGFDLDSEGLTQGVEDLITKLEEANSGRNEGLKQTFKEIGFETKDSKGTLKTGTTALLDFFDALAKIQDPAVRTRVIDETSSDFKKLAPLVENGKNELRDMLAEMQEFPGISEEVIEGNQELTKKVATLNQAYATFKSELLEFLLPGLLKFAEYLKEGARTVLDFAKNSSLFEAALASLGVLLTAVGVATVATWGPIAVIATVVATAFGGLVVIFNEIFETLKGKDTLVRDFLNTFLGAEQAEKSIENLNQSFYDLRKSGARTLEFLGLLFDDFATATRGGDSAIADLLDSIVGVEGRTSQVIAQMKVDFQALVDFIKDTVASAFDLLGGIIDTLTGTNFSGSIREKLGSFVNSVYEKGAKKAQREQANRLFEEKQQEYNILGGIEQDLAGAKNRRQREKIIRDAIARNNDPNNTNSLASGNLSRKQLEQLLAQKKALDTQGGFEVYKANLEQSLNLGTGVERLPEIKDSTISQLIDNVSRPFNAGSPAIKEGKKIELAQDSRVDIHLNGTSSDVVDLVKKEVKKAQEENLRQTLDALAEGE